MRLPNGKPPRMDLYGHNPFSARAPRLSRPRSGSSADFSDLDVLARWVDKNLTRAQLHRRLRLFLSEFSVPTDHANFEFNFHVTQRTQARWIRRALKITRRWSRIYTFGYLGLYDDALRSDNRPGRTRADRAQRAAQAGLHGVHEGLTAQRAPAPAATPRGAVSRRRRGHAAAPAPESPATPHSAAAAGAWRLRAAGWRARRQRPRRRPRAAVRPAAGTPRDRDASCRSGARAHVPGRRLLVGRERWAAVRVQPARLRRPRRLRGRSSQRAGRRVLERRARGLAARMRAPGEAGLAPVPDERAHHRLVRRAVGRRLGRRPVDTDAAEPARDRRASLSRSVEHDIGGNHVLRNARGAHDRRRMPRATRRLERRALRLLERELRRAGPGRRRPRGTQPCLPPRGARRSRGCPSRCATQAGREPARLARRQGDRDASAGSASLAGPAAIFRSSTTHGKGRRSSTPSERPCHRPGGQRLRGLRAAAQRCSTSVRVAPRASAAARPRRRALVRPVGRRRAAGRGQRQLRLCGRGSRRVPRDQGAQHRRGGRSRPVRVLGPLPRRRSCPESRGFGRSSSTGTSWSLAAEHDGYARLADPGDPSTHVRLGAGRRPGRRRPADRRAEHDARARSISHRARLGRRAAGRSRSGRSATRLGAGRSEAVATRRSSARRRPRRRSRAGCARRELGGWSLLRPGFGATLDGDRVAFEQARDGT